MAGSRSLGTLTVDLIAKIGGFVSGMTQAERQSSKTAAQIKRRHQQLARDLDTVYKGLGIGVTAAFAVISTSVKKSIDEMYDTVTRAGQLGLPVDQFSALSVVAKNAEVDVGTLTSALQAASNALASAQMSPTGRQGQAFAALGIDPKQITSVHDLILKASDALDKYQDGMGKTAVEMTIFGRSGAALAPLLAQGSAGIQDAEKHARDLGAAFGPEAAKLLSAYDDQMDELGNTVTGLRNTLAIQLLPAITSVTQQLTAFAQSSDAKDFASGLTTVLMTLARAGMVVAGSLDIAGKSLGGLFAIMSTGMQASTGARIAAAAAGPLGMLALFAKNGKQVAAVTKEVAADIAATYKTIFDQIANFGNGAPAAPKAANSWVQQWMAAGAVPITKPKLQFNPTTSAKAPKAPSVKPVKDYTAALVDQITQLTQSTTAYNVWKAAQDGATAAQQESVRNLSDALQAIQAQQKALDDLNNFLSQNKAVLNGVTDGEQKFSDTMAMATKALDAHRITWEQFQRVAAQQVDELNGHSKDATDQMSEYAKQAARNIQDSFADFLFDPFKDGVGGMVDNFATALRQMAAQALASKVFDMLGNWGKQNQGAGGWAGLLGGLASAFGSGHAGGGAVSPGMIYPVNERGTEVLSTGGRDYLLTGQSGGVVHPAGSAGGATVVNVNVQPTSTRATAMQTANAAARALALANQRA